MTSDSSQILETNYITLEDMHSWMRSHEGAWTPNEDDDGIICRLIESASRYIDHNTARKFYLTTETRYFNTPGWDKFIEYGGAAAGYLPSVQFYENKLRMDDDLFSVSSVVNGDGATLDPSQYTVIPYNTTPHYAILLRGNNVWKPSNASDPIMAISVTGSWGFCDIEDVPADLVEVCFSITKSALNRRFGENMTQRAVVTLAGAVISPEDVSSKDFDVIRCHQRIAIG